MRAYNSATAKKIGAKDALTGGRNTTLLTIDHAHEVELITHHIQMHAHLLCIDLVSWVDGWAEFCDGGPMAKNIGNCRIGNGGCGKQ